MDSSPDIVIVRDRLTLAELERLVERHFADMVKFVVDLDRRVVAVGGAMHADAEEVLLADGSLQIHLWGGNYYPGKGPVESLEFTSFLNIRPSQGNPAMKVMDRGLRERIGEGAEPGWPRSTPT